MGRSPSVRLSVMVLIGLASAACPGACLNLGPIGREWVVDEETGCCVERPYRRGVDPRGRPCSCSCSGATCRLNEALSAMPNSYPVICSDETGCATELTIDLACDSTP